MRRAADPSCKTDRRPWRTEHQAIEAAHAATLAEHERLEAETGARLGVPLANKPTSQASRCLSRWGRCLAGLAPRTYAGLRATAAVLRATVEDGQIQFACALRQKDVIREWAADGHGGQRWAWGLLWGEHVRADRTLTKATSRSSGDEVAEFALRLLPLAMAELQRTAPEARIGPVVRCEGTGRPWKQRLFGQRFREVARAAGIPDDVCNMDSRAGAVTETYDKGARDEDAMDLATHQEPKTNQRFNRGRMTKTSRVSTLRFGPKNEE